MASIVYEATSPSGERKQIHLDNKPTSSELVDALNHMFPDADFAHSEITGRGDRFRVDLREGGVFTVARLDRTES